MENAAKMTDLALIDSIGFTEAILWPATLLQWRSDTNLYQRQIINALKEVHGIPASCFIFMPDKSISVSVTRRNRVLTLKYPLLEPEEIVSQVLRDS